LVPAWRLNAVSEWPSFVRSFSRRRPINPEAPEMVMFTQYQSSHASYNEME
jgi:hypothetical protein